MYTEERIIPFSTNQYKNNIIVYIDLIGFKNLVLSTHANGNIENVLSLISYFQKDVSEGEKKLKGNAFSFRPSFNLFSDSIIFSYPLDLFNTPSELKTAKLADSPEIFIDNDKSTILFSVSNRIADIQLQALQYGILTRGCLTVGDIYHNQNIWFGPGIIEAYEHESKIAIFPRVILSKNAYEYFRNEITYSATRSLLCDADGFFYVNYIGGIHTKMGNDYCSAHHKLRKIITDNLGLLSEAKKIKERHKWEWLSMYFNRITIDKLQQSPHGTKLAELIEL